MSGTKERFDNMDGLKAIACMAIIAMHVRANAAYSLPQGLVTVIASWTNCVPLFLMLSGFGMFCGYYEKCKAGTLNLNTFYARRYGKILPFFALLIVLDLIMERSTDHLIEGAMEATLVFGLLPNNQPQVVGVSWTLGVIFLFYMLFSFFVFLCWTKRRAWISMAVSILLLALCSMYYFSDRFVVAGFDARHSFFYCAPFFLGGGLAYLHREFLKPTVAKLRFPVLTVAIGATVAWYFIPGDDTWVLMMKNLVVFALWLIYAIGVKSPVLHNRVMKVLAGMSLELYLCHMVFFRILEKLKVLYIFGKGTVGYVFAFFAVSCVAIAFVTVYKFCVNYIVKRFIRKDAATDR